jgi:hypothetical protein
MKKILSVLLASAFMMTSFTGCGTTGSSSSTAGSVVTTVLEALLVEYITGSLGTSTSLASSLSKATGTTTLASLTGGDAVKTELLSSLVSSKFSIQKDAVTSAISSTGSTVNSLAKFIETNSSEATLKKVLNVK